MTCPCCGRAVTQEAGRNFCPYCLLNIPLSFLPRSKRDRDTWGENTRHAVESAIDDAKDKDRKWEDF